MSAQIIGIIGVLKFYQEAYGTLVYFVSYMYNKRYEGTNLFVSFSFVLLANGIWYVHIYNICSYNILKSHVSLVVFYDIALMYHMSTLSIPYFHRNLLLLLIFRLYCTLDRFVFPAVGMWASIDMIVYNDYSIFRRAA